MMEQRSLVTGPLAGLQRGELCVRTADMMANECLLFLRVSLNQSSGRHWISRSSE